MKKIIFLIVIFLLSGCNQETESNVDKQCYDGYILINNECVVDEQDSIVCTNNEYDSNGVCIRELDNMQELNNKIYLKYDLHEIGGYDIYYKFNYGLHCDYFRPVDIVFDLYYTESTRYGYSAYNNDSCFDELYIIDNNLAYTLEDAFLEGLLTIELIENNQLTLDLKEQLVSIEDIDLWGKGIYFGSVVKEYQIEGTETQFYIYDFTGYSCIYSADYMIKNWSDSLINQRVYESISTGTNCGSPLFVKDENGNMELYSINEQNSVEEVEFVFKDFNYFEFSYWSYEYNKSVVSILIKDQEGNEINLKQEFLDEVRHNFNDLIIIKGLNEFSKSSEVNLYERFHQETDFEYVLFVSFSDNSTQQYILRNGVLFDSERNEFLSDSFIVMHSDYSGLFDRESSPFLNLEDYRSD